MSWRKTILFPLLIFSTSSTFAYEAKEGNITASFGPYFSRTDYDKADSGAAAPYRRGWGLLLTGDVSEASALEFSVFHLQKSYLRNANFKFVSEKTELIHILMGYRRWLHPQVSASLSFASAYSIGSTTLEYNDFPDNEIPTTSAKDTTEYGFEGSLQLELWRFEKWDLIGEGRYFYSLTSKSSERANHYGGFIGIRYLVQDRPPSNQ